jgi:hypothetical protein
VFLGDLNILEPGHKPRYPFFAPYEYGFYQALVTDLNMTDCFRHHCGDALEYSWVGRTGDGYRYDHAFCSTETKAPDQRMRIPPPDPARQAHRPLRRHHPARHRPTRATAQQPVDGDHAVLSHGYTGIAARSRAS